MTRTQLRKVQSHYPHLFLTDKDIDKSSGAFRTMANDERHARWREVDDIHQPRAIGHGRWGLDFFKEWTPCSNTSSSRSPSSSFDGNCVKFLPGDDNVTSWKFQGSEDDAGALLPLLGW